MAEATGTPSGPELCSWCGNDVDPGDAYHLTERPGDRRAAFCRLEHLVPWAIRGAHWAPGSFETPEDGHLDSCSFCGTPLGEIRVVLVHRRGEQEVPDAFCSVDHACGWAKAGGRYSGR